MRRALLFLTLVTSLAACGGFSPVEVEIDAESPADPYPDPLQLTGSVATNGHPLSTTLVFRSWQWNSWCRPHAGEAEPLRGAEGARVMLKRIVADAVTAVAAAGARLPPDPGVSALLARPAAQPGPCPDPPVP